MKPVLDIFFKTRQTFDSVDDQFSSKQLNLIFLVCSFSVAVQSVLKDFAGLDNQAFWYLFLLLAFTTGFLFAAFKYAFSWLYWKISRLFKGKASLKQTRIVVAYALIPALIFLFIYALLTGLAIFYRSPDVFSRASSITQLVVVLLTLRIAVIGLAHVNKFSYFYGLLVFLIPTVVLQLLYLGIAKM